jgi:hypothetical protein
MKFSGKTLGLLLASLALASCGGGGGDGGAFSAPQSGSISLTATTTQLPIYTGSGRPGPGTPYEAEIDATWKNADGTLVTSCGNAATACHVSASISPVTVAGLGIADDPTTTTINEAAIIYTTTPVTVNTGHATFWVVASSTAGTAVLTVSAADPTTGRTVTSNLTFTITSGVGPAPASITLASTPAGIYLPSSGGVSASSIQAAVLDGGGQLVADPTTGNGGFDNIKFELIGQAGDAVLSTNSVAGPVQGASVTSHTVQGIAVVSLQAGDNTPQGPLQVRVTVDRADNNVTNGIQDPVSKTTSVIVSDGKLYSLELTTPLIAPNLPGITINCVTSPCNAVSGDVTGPAIPTDPDATLSLVFTAKGQDRQGNPVLPGTPIRFGSVDEPVGAPGSANDNQFLLSGFDGNPQEGGTTFTAPTGEFTTGGGGAGPGDALIVFGKAVEGNADLESAATVASVNSATNLTVASAFNRNDTTGVTVDSGSVLPYLIGRSLHGSVTASALTDAGLAAGAEPTGVAHATLTYTVNTVGNSVAVWAQGDGIDTVTNGARRVTDAGTFVYPGVAPLSIVASPNPIFGNQPQTVTVCVTDALGIKLRGVQLGYVFALAGGSGTVDGQSGNSGSTRGATDAQNGCVDVAVTTSGVPISDGTSGNSGTLTFNAGGATAVVNVVVQLASLQSSVGTCVQVPVPTGNKTTAISILATSAGVPPGPVPGVDVGAACAGGGGSGTGTGGGGTLTVTPTSATTGSNGVASFSVVAAGFTSTTSLQCVFTATNGNSQSVTVKFQGSGASTDGDPSPVGGCQ